MVQILSTPLIVSFSRPQNRETNGGNETIGGGLKQLEEIEDFLQNFSKFTVVKLNKSGIYGLLLVLKVFKRKP